MAKLMVEMIFWNKLTARTNNTVSDMTNPTSSILNFHSSHSPAVICCV